MPPPLTPSWQYLPPFSRTQVESST